MRRRPRLPDPPDALVATGALLAAICGWSSKGATNWPVPAEIIGLAPGELWSLATTALTGLAAWGIARCFAPPAPPPAAANDNPGRPPLPCIFAPTS